ncbi:MAG: hypothetical protein ACWGIK_10525 [Achromobacter pulmonis]|uniref:Uncharacterized protein n=1 Tax=Achromobacter pulmonis TaxID=1389932 RepID=A0A6S7EK17_9BURK|nr:hypothetical protein [Achromobacter pulmonis]CAB3661197.1 hypothetical protein LMG26696_03381 [Achromobacter pulmonis]CAB3915662.1 hypothetical protein LMG26788_05044 [Achromobacter pulmonis]
MRTACGATLIASQYFWREALAEGNGSGASSNAPPSEVTSAPTAYRGRFQAIDDATRESVAGRHYRVTSMNGAALEGTTDADGYTAWIESQSPDMLSLELLAHEQEEAS